MNEQYFTPEEVNALNGIWNRVEEINKDRNDKIKLDLSVFTDKAGHPLSLLNSVREAHKILDEMTSLD